MESVSADGRGRAAHRLDLVRASVTRGGPAALPSQQLDSGATAARVLDGLMDRFAQGDDGAFEELYRLGAPRVRAFLVRICADVALADDLTQEAFLRVHRARATFVANAAAIPWMLTIARNTLRDHARRERVRRTHQASAAEDHDDRQSAATHHFGDRAVIARQMLEVAQQALLRLPVRQREAFVLLRFEGLSLEEAAQVLGTTEAAVKIMVHRACVAIRTTLDRQEKKRAGQSR
jgi:RNA polymerase sigma-70 factor (ECF subfamily)